MLPFIEYTVKLNYSSALEDVITPLSDRELKKEKGKKTLPYGLSVIPLAENTQTFPRNKLDIFLTVLAVLVSYQ